MAVSQATVDETIQTVNRTCHAAGAPYSDYSCKQVSWDDCARGTSMGQLSCLGANITDTRLCERGGAKLYTVRSDNWNEKLGCVPADEIRLLTGQPTDSEGFTLVAPDAARGSISLREFLVRAGKHGGYAGLDAETDLECPEMDDKVSIRFQTTFLPAPEDGKVEFCSEAYNCQSLSDQNPKNLVLLCSSQGTAVQQHGAGSQRIFHHTVEPDGRIARHWLEAERTGHRVGAAQEEGAEAAQAAREAAEEAAKEEEALRWCAEALAPDVSSSQDVDPEQERAAKRLKEAEIKRQTLEAEARERDARAEEAANAAAAGKATAQRLGTPSMGSRCNALLTVQVPLEQKTAQRSTGLSSSSYYNAGSPSAPALGIDLGTCYSCVGVFQNDGVEIIADGQGNRCAPSCVAYTDVSRLVGEPAKVWAARHPERALSGAKQLLGRKLNDPHVERLRERLPLQFARGTDGLPALTAMGKAGEEVAHSPAEVLAILLAELRASASQHCGQELKDAVITVPASFNDAQRQATKDAGTMAGLNVLRLINEPTAAAIAYGLDKGPQEERHVVVFDMGGSRTSASLLCIEDGIFEVKAAVDDDQLGGQDLDDLLVDYCLAEFKKRHPDRAQDLAGNVRALNRLRLQCELAKRSLSHSLKASVEVEELLNGLDFQCTLYRGRWEDMARGLLRKAVGLIDNCLSEGGIPKAEVHDVILVGGSTLVPAVQKLVKEVLKHSTLHVSISPEEVVAWGASVQARILTGHQEPEMACLLLLDVTPLSQGIVTEKGLVQKIIPRNSTIPCRSTATVSMHSQDGRLRIPVVEGERALGVDCHTLGEVTLEGLPSGSVLVDVVFDVDANGILTVSAVEPSTGSKASIRISNDKGRLSHADIQRMVEEARLHEASDEALRDRLRAGQASAARVSCGSLEDYWPGLAVGTPRRDRKQHCTVTVQLYHVVVGGVPSAEDVRAAVDEMESLYAACGNWHGRLADKGADFMKSELKDGDLTGILEKVVMQPSQMGAGPQIDEVD